MPDKSSNVPSNIAYSSVVAESLRFAKANNNPVSFSTAVSSEYWDYLVQFPAPSPKKIKKTLWKNS